MATTGGVNIVTDGLVLALDAANVKSYPGSGTTWRDLSGNGYNGTLVNSPTFDSGNGGSLVFDGTNDSISINNNNLYDLQLTIVQWVNVTGFNRVSHFFSKDEFPAYWASTEGSGGTLYFYIRDDDTSAYVGRRVINSDGILDSGILMLTVTYNGGIDSDSVSFYKNGSLLSTSNYSFPTFTEPRQNTSDIQIGFFEGAIFNTIVYNRALSSTEVLQNYNATKSRFNL